MNIQSSFNQAISLASLLYTQTPEYKKRGEIKELTKERKTQEMESKHIEDILADETASDEKIDDAAEREAELAAEEYSTIKDLYKVTGDKSLYKDILARVPSKQGEVGREIRGQRALAREEAEKSLADKQAEKRATREFMNMFLKGTPSQYANEYKGGNN